MQIDIKLKGINGHNIFGSAPRLSEFRIRYGNSTKTRGKLSRRRIYYGDETNVYTLM